MTSFWIFGTWSDVYWNPSSSLCISSGRRGLVWHGRSVRSNDSSCMRRCAHVGMCGHAHALPGLGVRAFWCALPAYVSLCVNCVPVSLSRSLQIFHTGMPVRALAYYLMYAN